MALGYPQKFSYLELAQKEYSANIGPIDKIQELMDKASIVLQRNNIVASQCSALVSMGYKEDVPWMPC